MPSPVWETLDCALDAGPGPILNIGLIALGYDAVIEGELRAFLALGASVQTTRIANATNLDEITRAATLFRVKVDVVAFACTSAAAELGPARVAAAVHAALPGTRVTDPAEAAVAAMRKLGLRRIALLTPYGDEESEKVARHLEAHDFDPSTRGSFKQRDENIDRIAPESVLNAAIALGARDVDGIFISCTGLRTSGIVAEAERRIGKPVISSAQALAWRCLDLAEGARQGEGVGRLMRG